MARDMNQLVERMRSGHDLVLTEDGQIVNPDDPTPQEGVAGQSDGPVPQRDGVLLKHERFGV